MARTVVTRHAMGLNNIRLVGNSDLNLATSYLEIVSPQSGGNYTNFDPDSDSFTISLWAYLEHTGLASDYNYSISIIGQTDSNGGFALNSGIGVGRNWLLSNVSTGEISSFLGFTTRSSGFLPTVNTFYMYTLVRDKAAQTLKFYVNDIAYNSFSSVVSFESCTGKMRIGANRGAVRSMGGYVEKPRLIKGIAMTAAQVSALYYTDTVPGTAAQKEFEVLGTGSTSLIDTGANTYTVTLNNSASINTNQSFVKFPARSVVARSVVTRTVI